jgi:hypothetical protein
MRTVVKLLVCVSIFGFAAKATAGDLATEQRKSDLAAVLRELNEPQHPDSHIEHPGWCKPEVREKVRSIVEKHPNTEEALTAELWLATAELEEGQTVVNRLKRREGLLAVASVFAHVIKSSPDSWQAKAARIGRTGALLAAREWNEVRNQAMEILADISSYNQESNKGYVEFWRTHRATVADAEPEVRRMLLVATTCSGKTTEAIALAEEMQTKFPEWSRKTLPGIIEVLTSGNSPFGDCR